MGFGRGLGRVWEGLLATFLDFFTTFCGLLAIWRKNQNFEAFGRGLGRVLGGSGEGFGMVLGGSGSLLGAVGRTQGCCMLFFVIFCILDIFGVVVALSDASAASVARLQGGCLLFFERAKRASEALWCFLWVSMALCACTALLLSGTFLCLLLLLWVLLLLLVLLPLVGNFGPLQLHASTTF